MQKVSQIHKITLFSVVFQSTLRDPPTVQFESMKPRTISERKSTFRNGEAAFMIWYDAKAPWGFLLWGGPTCALASTCVVADARSLSKLYIPHQQKQILRT